MSIFKDLDQPLTVARYHSLFAIEDTLPDELEVTARSPEGVIMALRYKTLPIAATQFHPDPF